MDLSKVIAYARKLVGVKEIPKGSNRGPSVDAITGGRAEPWCAHFVAHVFRVSGIPLPNDVVPTPSRANPLASVSFMEKTFQTKGWIVADRKPKPGDVVFYLTRGKSDRGPGRHVGIIVEVGDGFYHSVEGNWGDGVAVRTVSLTDGTIANFGRIP